MASTPPTIVLPTTIHPELCLKNSVWRTLFEEYRNLNEQLMLFRCFQPRIRYLQIFEFSYSVQVEYNEIRVQFKRKQEFFVNKSTLGCNTLGFVQLVKRKISLLLAMSQSVKSSRTPCWAWTNSKHYSDLNFNLQRILISIFVNQYLFGAWVPYKALKRKLFVMPWQWYSQKCRNNDTCYLPAQSELYHCSVQQTWARTTWS